MPPSVTVALPEGRAYDVAFAPLSETPRLLAEAGLRPGPCLLVTDANVGPRYLGGLVGALEGAGWTPRARMVPPGEASKGTASLGALYDWALSPPEGHAVPDRQTPVLALGGGVVGDLAGFFAATLLRGLPLVHLPTTLVAQADSAIGGKTGVNHPSGKNLIGAFHQPRLVVADPATLQTLPEREWTSGLAEVVKAALIADASFFDWLEATWEAVSAREPEAVETLVRRSVGIKAEVVAEDERESGRRGILNFGHTFGHAIERVGGYGACTHGEAVAVGMRAALYLSSLLSPTLDRARADALVARLPVPPAVADLPLDALFEAMHHDKKRAEGRLRFVVLDQIGSARLTDEPSARQVETAWAFALGAVRASSRAA